METPVRALDKSWFTMVKYIGKLNIVMSGKSSISHPIREPGTLAGSLGRNEMRKCVRERNVRQSRVINESGTAASAASYTQLRYKRLFFFTK